MSYRNPFSPTHLLQQRIAQAALLRDGRDMTGNFFAFQRPDTNRNSTIHYSSVTTQSSYGNPTWTSVLLTHSCTHVLRASLGRRAACTRETCLHIRARISSLQRNSDLGFLNSHTRRVMENCPGSWTCFLVLPHCVTWNLQWRHLSHAFVRNPFSPRLLLQQRIAQASVERSRQDSTGRSS